MEKPGGLPKATDVVRDITAKFSEGGGAGASDGGQGGSSDDGQGGGQDDLLGGGSDGGDSGSGSDDGSGNSQPGAKDQGGSGGKDGEGGNKGGKGEDRMVPLSELKKERQKRQEIEAKLAEFDRIKPDYENLLNFDRQLGAFFKANPAEFERMKSLMAGKVAKAEETAEAVEDQIAKFGSADPELVKLFKQQSQELKGLQKRLDERETKEQSYIEQQRQLRHFETEINQIETEFPDLKDDKEAMEAIIDLAEARNASSLIPIAKAYMAREAKLKEKVLAELAKKNPKREGSKLEGPGAAGGVKKELKPIGDDDRATQIAAHFAARG